MVANQRSLLEREKERKRHQENNRQLREKTRNTKLISQKSLSSHETNKKNEKKKPKPKTQEFLSLTFWGDESHHLLPSRTKAIGWLINRKSNHLLKTTRENDDDELNNQTNDNTNQSQQTERLGQAAAEEYERLYQRRHNLSRDKTKTKEPHGVKFMWN